MAGVARSSTTTPTRANLVDEIRALRVEIDAANRKMQRRNDTIISQANELTTLRNIICQNCKRKFLDATFDSSPSPAPRSRPLHGLADLSTSSPTASSTSVAAEHTLISPEATAASPPQAPLSRTTGITRAHIMAPPSSSAPHSDPVASRSLSSQTSLHGYPVLSSATASPVSNGQEASLQAIPVPFHSTYEVPTSRLISKAGTSTISEPAAVHSPPGRTFRKTGTSSVISSSDAIAARPRDPEHHTQWPVTRGPEVENPLRVTFQRAFTHKSKVQCVKFSLDGRYLAIGLSGGYRDCDGRVIIYSTATWKQTCLLVEHTKEDQWGVRTICFSPNGKDIAIGCYDGHIRLWIIATKRVRNRFRGHRGAVTDLDFSPNLQSVVSASVDNSVRVWGVRDGSSRVLNDEYWTQYWCARFSPDGEYVAAADRDGLLRMWDSRTHQLVIKWRGHRGIVSSLAFTPDGKGLVSGSFDGFVKYWDVPTLGDDQSASTIKDAMMTLHNLHTNQGSLTSVTSIAIAADGQWLLSGSHDRTARLWNISNGPTQQCSLDGHPGWIWSVDISSAGNYFALGDQEGQVSLWRYKVMRNC